MPGLQPHTIGAPVDIRCLVLHKPARHAKPTVSCSPMQRRASVTLLALIRRELADVAQQLTHGQMATSGSPVHCSGAMAIAGSSNRRPAFAGGQLYQLRERSLLSKVQCTRQLLSPRILDRPRDQPVPMHDFEPAVHWNQGGTGSCSRLYSLLIVVVGMHALEVVSHAALPALESAAILRPGGDPRVSEPREQRLRA